MSRSKQVIKLRELRDRNAEKISEQEKIIRKLESAFIVLFSISAILLMTLISVLITRANKYDLNLDGEVDIRDVIVLENAIESLED